MHVTDDHGKRVTLLPQVRFSIIPGVQSPIPAECRRLMIRENARIRYKKRVPIPVQVFSALIYVIWYCAWWFMFRVLFNSFNLPDVLQYAVIPTLFLGAVPILCWVYTQAICEATARIIANYGYCASCGYSLTRLTPADDGCTVCPECGSAWRIPAPNDP